MSTTQNIFDRIATGWYNFRHRTIFRHELESLAARWRQGRLLNIGCAHGPDFIPFKEAFELHGIDLSPGMLEQAKRYAKKFDLAVNLIEADARYLPFSDNFFDWAIAVAVFHHIEDKEGRLRALRELYRVLKPGGEAFITVWNRWQPRFWFKPRNTLVPWHSREETYHRYYYLFSYGELEKTARRAGFSILKSFPELKYKFPLKILSRNICLLVRKEL